MPLTDVEQHSLQIFANQNDAYIQDAIRLMPNQEAPGGGCASFVMTLINSISNLNLGRDKFPLEPSLPNGHQRISNYQQLLGCPTGAILVMWNPQESIAIHYVIHVGNGIVLGENHGGFMLQDTRHGYRKTISAIDFQPDGEFLYERDAHYMSDLIHTMARCLDLARRCCEAGFMSSAYREIRDELLYNAAGYFKLCTLRYDSWPQAGYKQTEIRAWRPFTEQVCNKIDRWESLSASEQQQIATALQQLHISPLRQIFLYEIPY